LIATHREGGYVYYTAVFRFTGDQLHPGDPQRKEVFDAASRNTSVAAHTLYEVDDHSPFHCFSPFSLYGLFRSAWEGFTSLIDPADLLLEKLKIDVDGIRIPTQGALHVVCKMA
jgi:hypothetical protein